MKWISLKDKIPGVYKNFVLYVYYEAFGGSYCSYAIMTGFRDSLVGFVTPERTQTDIFSYIEPLMWCEIPFPDQPDRSKREDSFKKRCGTQNTDDKSVREVQ